MLDLLRDYGLDDFYVELSTKPETKAVGSDEEWNEAIEVLRTVALDKGMELVMDEGGGAFYGPKISVQARDAIGRKLADVAPSSSTSSSRSGSTSSTSAPTASATVR